ncbi:MAG: hypothetical protein ABSC64_11640 [Candidatus Korobacteraceae bacterium]
MSKGTIVPSLFLALALTLLAGCGSSQPAPPAPASLSVDNVNLIFVVSEDLAYQASGDVNPKTANLTNKGLQRSLLMATFLQQNVLGAQNVTGIYALEPMTHLQTAGNYPDMIGLETIQQFAMLNQITLSHGSNSPVTANSCPLNASYSSAPVPDGVAQPFLTCPSGSGLPPYSCQGLDFRDLEHANETLVSDIVKANTPGFYVFSAPWETVSTLMASINRLKGYNLSLPASYISPNYIYAISITPSGGATLVTYNSNVVPPSSYPTLPAGGILKAACLPSSTNTTFHIQVTGGIGGVIVPAGVNTNETVYLVRHAEAHPTSWWEDGNYIAAGQWRALDLPYALRGKIQPTQVYSIDPAQVTPGSTSQEGNSYSYVRTNLTVLPYAIANNLPYNLAASFELLAQNPPALATAASNFFFTGSTFSNQSLLVGWEHDHIPPTVNALLATYHEHDGPTAPNWPDDDFDTVWTVKLDANGNLSINNTTCEGINSAALPATPPQF